MKHNQLDLACEVISYCRRCYDSKIFEGKGILFNWDLGSVQGISERHETSSSSLLSPLLLHRRTCNLSSTSHLQKILLC